VLLLAALARGQNGTTPKASPADYPVQAKIGELVVAAEYLVHSVSSAGQTFIVPDYLVVDVAVYPPKAHPVDLAAGQFSVRLNGKPKDVLYPEAAAFVAASLKHPDWEQQRGLEGGIGVGGVGVSIPGSPPAGRFPGDGREPPDRTPPQAPDRNSAGAQEQPRATAEEAVVNSALPEDRFKGPVSGHLYFAYRGKLRKLKSLELVYRHGGGETVLRLF
jgi:hypothetical protein